MTSRSHTPEGIIDAMDHEARHILRTSRMDLDAFLACDQAERARRWRQFDHSAKWQLVALMIERRGYDWDEASIQHWIGHYDERYALPPVEAAVEGALERLATESSDAARCAAASEAPHLVRMDGDWVCSCPAGASLHWPIALVTGDAETARLASKGELRAELERVQAERAAARACYRVAV